MMKLETPWAPIGAATIVITLLAVPSATAHAAILTVDSEADAAIVDAECTLREAIIEANRSAGAAVYVECGAPDIGATDTVVFDASVDGETISVLSTLEIAGDVATVIDGVGSDVTVDGSALIADSVFRVTADFATIRGLTIDGGFRGVEVLGGDSNTVGAVVSSDGNLIRNASLVGVTVVNGTGNRIIGNTIIDNDDYGIWTSTDVDTLIENNHVGVDASSNFAGNRDGIFALSSTNLAVENNVISGNNSDGVYISGGTVTLIENLIGLDATGALERSNGSYGVRVQNDADVTIGGTAVADRNWISGNNSGGVFVDGPTAVVHLQFNRIGTNLDGTIAIGNSNDGVRLFEVGTATLVKNLISGNNRHGVSHVTGIATLRGNRIGVTSALASLPNGDDGVHTSDVMRLRRNVLAFHSGAGVHVAAGGDLVAGSEGNCISGNTTGLFDDTDLDITIVNSWWGDASGPSGAGGGSGDPLTLNNFFGVTAYLPVQAAPSIACP